MPARLCINTPNVINEVMDGEAVIIDLASGDYYSLRGSGAFVWTAIEQQASTDEIVAAFVRTGAAPAAEVEAAVARLLEELTAEGLVVPADGHAEASPAESRRPLPTPTGFEHPRLEKFTDMQDLILLDPVHEVDERGWPHLARTP